MRAAPGQRPTARWVVVNGVIGGATGLAGIAGVIWSSMRGWSPAEQRAVFQPAGVAVFAMTALWLGGTGMIGAEYPAPVPDRPAGACRGHLGRAENVRQNRRRGVPPGRPGAV